MVSRYREYRLKILHIGYFCVPNLFFDVPTLCFSLLSLPLVLHLLIGKSKIGNRLVSAAWLNTLNVYASCASILYPIKGTNSTHPDCAPPMNGIAPIPCHPYLHFGSEIRTGQKEPVQKHYFK